MTSIDSLAQIYEFKFRSKPPSHIYVYSPLHNKSLSCKENCSDRTFGFPPDSSCWCQTEFNLETAARLHLDLNSCFSHSTFHFQVLSSSPNFI